MLRCDNNLSAGNSTDTSVFENRLCQDQRYSDQSRQSYQLDTKTIESCTMSRFHNLINNNSMCQEMTSRYMKADQCFGSIFPEFGDCRMAGSEFVGDTTSRAVSELEIGSSFGMNNSLSVNLTSSKARKAAAAAAVAETGGGSDSTEKTAANVMIGGSKSRKRKTEVCAVSATTIRVNYLTQFSLNMKSNFDGEAERCNGQNGIRGEARQEEFADNSKDKAKFSTDQKPDYIHLRAPRGQATDSHSLAERARREKINKKMKCLQELVPGCSKVTGKAGMLDEIINYVQSLQRQVEFLSMKLASSNSTLDFNINSPFTKEYPAHLPSFPAAAAPFEMANLAYLQFNQAQQGATGCVINMPTNLTDELPSQKTPSSSPLPFPAVSLDSFCFPQVQPHPTWENDIQKPQ